MSNIDVNSAQRWFVEEIFVDRQEKYNILNFLTLRYGRILFYQILRSGRERAAQKAVINISTAG